MQINKKEYMTYGIVLLLSVSSILYGQGMKHLFAKMKGQEVIFNFDTVCGMVVLWFICMVALFIHMLLKENAFLSKLPLLGWVSILSIIFCLPGMPTSVFFIRSIKAVDLLAITTVILAYAGISVVDRMVELGKTSWKIAVVSIFVFIGTYVGSATIAQIGLMIMK